ncbi:16987_t:CDS:2, partial [Cetraspora pellucida]
PAIKEESKDNSTLSSTTQNFKVVEKSFPIDSYDELDLEFVKIKKEEGVDEKSSVVFKKRKLGSG